MLKLRVFDQRELRQPQAALSTLTAIMVQAITRKSNTLQSLLWEISSRHHIIPDSNAEERVGKLLDKSLLPSEETSLQNPTVKSYSQPLTITL